RWPEQKQTQQRKYSGNRVQHDHYLAMRKAKLQKLVMDVFAVRCEDWTSTDETADDRKSCLQNRKSEGDDRNRHRNNRRSFLSTSKRQSAEHEADEEAAAVDQKNCCRIEIKSEESENRAYEGERHQRNHPCVAQQGNRKHHQG